MEKKRSAVNTNSSSGYKRHRLQTHMPGAQGRALGIMFDQFMSELAPVTPLETSIARDIASNDADLTMMRARRNMILWQKAITPMYAMLRKLDGLDDAVAGEMAKDWASGMPEVDDRIRALGIDPEFAHNQAYIENFLLIDAIDRQIERLERRRRQLLDDYRRMKPAPERRARVTEQIADAELLRGNVDEI
jgi:hypothetical protein